MYAIIATGGKQYKVSEGDVIKIEKLDAEAGNTVTFDQILAVSDNGLKVGSVIIIYQMKKHLNIYYQTKERILLLIVVIVFLYFIILLDGIPLRKSSALLHSAIYKKSKN